MSQKNILHISLSSKIGGASSVRYSIIKNLRSQFRLIVASPNDGFYFEKIKKLSVPLYPISSGNLSFLNIFKLGYIIKREKIDLIHTHGTRAAFWTRLAIICLKNKPKIVYTLHGFHIIRRNFLIRWLLIIMERFLNKWTNVLVCVSEADKNLVLKHKTISKNKVVLIKNGINIEKFQVEPRLIESMKRELGLGNNFIVTTVGRLHPPKDFSTILSAVKLTVPRIRNLRLLIIGDGPLRESLGKETKNLGLDEYVKFLGSQEDTPVLINLSDIIVLSTKWEGLPLVPLEAGASKKPIIASDVDGVRETIINGKTGYLFRPASEKDLAEKILRLFDSEKLREQIGKTAFEFVSRNFSKEKMVKGYQNLYELLL